MRRMLIVLSLAFSCSAVGCGYSWQNTGNPWAKKDQVRKVFVRTLVNNTLKAGVEVPFTSALVREFARGQRVQLVADEGDADGYLEGEVTDVSSKINSELTVTQLSRSEEAKALSDMVIASDYVTNATINIRLVKKGTGRMLWSQTFSRSKVYPGNNRFGLEGTTSSLINASQEALAVGEIAQFLASDAHDTLLEAF